MTGRLLALRAPVLVVAACGSDTTICPGQDFTANATGSATAADVRSILAQNCALGGCHLSSPGAGGLVLDASSSAWVSALVGVPAQESPSLELVAPGDPDRSWIVHKIFGEFCGTTCSASSGCGGQMPFGGQLSPTDQGTIVEWIMAGATGP
jgi:hypothetical protein